MLSEEEIMAQVLAAFQEEQAEHRQNISDILLDLERYPDHPKYAEKVQQLFRDAHSLKGGARAVGIDAVEQLAHRMEDLFSKVRDGTLQLTPDVCDVLYAALDTIGVMMQHVDAGQTASIERYQPLLEQLGAAIRGNGAAAAVVPPASEPPVPAEPPTVPAEPRGDGEAEPPTVPAEPRGDGEAEPPTVPAEPRGDGEAEPPTVPAELRSDGEAELRSEGEAVPPASDEALPQSNGAAEPQDAPSSEETASTTVRLSVSVLDNLLNETGELITSAARERQYARDARMLLDVSRRWQYIWRYVQPSVNRVQQQQAEQRPTVHYLMDHIHNMSYQSHGGQHGEGGANGDTFALLDALKQAHTIINDLEQHLADHVRRTGEEAARLSTITSRLHDQIRATRMLPLGTLLQPMRVQVREMSRSAEKIVVLDIDDGQAEADREVLDNLREVLLHLIRNAIDHGIEPAAVRTAQGKPAEGHITMRAAVSGDYLELVVEDDGAGLDREAIKDRACEANLLKDTDMERVSDADLIDLIFLPGFSTRHTVNAMSGRGVGLDVVRSRVERMHGNVSVRSVMGQGCAFTIRVPLSLTSSHGLLLKIGTTTYMLPLETIQRIVAVKPEDVRFVEGYEVVMLDNYPIKLVHLAELLGEVYRATTSATNGKHDSNNRAMAVLLGNGERQIACLIDEILGEQELVVHRLPTPLKRVRFIAGATLLEDGRVVPILDSVDVLRAATGTHKTVLVDVEQGQQERSPTIVVVDDSITTRMLEKNILEAAGYSVHMATDGVQALKVLNELVNNGGCDLLLSDVDMPNLDGFELTKQVCNDPQLRHMPVVLVTSLDSPSDRERGMSAGASAYIVKRSFDQQELLDTIADLI